MKTTISVTLDEVKEILKVKYNALVVKRFMEDRMDLMFSEEGIVCGEVEGDNYLFDIIIEDQ